MGGGVFLKFVPIKKRKVGINFRTAGLLKRGDILVNLKNLGTKKLKKKTLLFLSFH